LRHLHCAEYRKPVLSTTTNLGLSSE